MYYFFGGALLYNWVRATDCNGTGLSKYSTSTAAVLMYVEVGGIQIKHTNVQYLNPLNIHLARGQSNNLNCDRSQNESGLHSSFLKNNMNTSRPSAHPPQSGGKMSKRLVGGIIIGCKDKIASWHLNGLFSDGSKV